MELELGVLGVHRKLVKYVVHLSKRKNFKKIIFLDTSCPNSIRPIFGLKEFKGLKKKFTQLNFAKSLAKQLENLEL